MAFSKKPTFKGNGSLKLLTPSMNIVVKEAVRCLVCGDVLSVCFKKDATSSTYYCNNDNCDRLGLVAELALDQIEDKVVHV